MLPRRYCSIARCSNRRIVAAVSYISRRSWDPISLIAFGLRCRPTVARMFVCESGTIAVIIGDAPAELSCVRRAALLSEKAEEAAMAVTPTQEILGDAFRDRYGVAAINVVNDLTLEAVLAAAEELRAPLI